MTVKMRYSPAMRGITVAAAAVALTMTVGGGAIASKVAHHEGVARHQSSARAAVDYQVESSAQCAHFSITVWQRSGARDYTVTQDGALIESFSLDSDDGGLNGYPSETVSRDYTRADGEHVIRLKSEGVVIRRLDLECNGV